MPILCCVAVLVVLSISCVSTYPSAEDRRAKYEQHLLEITRLQNVLARTPSDFDALQTLATHQWAAGLYDEAQHSFEKATTLSDSSAVTQRLAALLYQRGRYLQAASVATNVAVGSTVRSQPESLSELIRLVDTVPRAPIAEFSSAAQPNVSPSNSIGLVLVSVPGGTFLRGDSSGAPDRLPVRHVTVSPFRMGMYEVTVGQYNTFLNEIRDKGIGVDGSTRVGGVPDNHPAYGVSWNDAVAFTIWLSAREQAVYRLPTEAEWEFAVRANKGFREPWGNSTGRPQVDGNWGRTGATDLKRLPPPTAPVGKFPRDRSPFGIFDMAGNVSEWCLDEYDPTYYSWSPDKDPYGPTESNGVKVIRGGAWNYPAESSGFALMRSKAAQNQAYTGYGFRVVREIP
jgi:formylglycine-generating enzyme required for sulfatase activity